MNISLSSRFFILIILLNSLLFISCQKSEEKDIEPDKKELISVYDNWNSYRYENLVFKYPKNFIYADSLFSYAHKYKAMIRQDCLLLQIDIPVDTLIIILYTGVGQGLEYTGKNFPFSSGDTLHFWGNTQFGVPLMEYFVNRWSNKQSKHPFIKNGLMLLMGATSRNFHHETFGYIDSNIFIPLKELAVDTSTTVGWGWFQSVESASFVDYVMYKHGVNSLKILYESPVSFDSTVVSLFQMSTDSLEQDWLSVVGEATGRNK